MLSYTVYVLVVDDKVELKARYTNWHCFHLFFITEALAERVTTGKITMKFQLPGIFEKYVNCWWKITGRLWWSFKRHCLFGLLWHLSLFAGLQFCHSVTWFLNLLGKASHWSRCLCTKQKYNNHVIFRGLEMCNHFRLSQFQFWCWYPCSPSQNDFTRGPQRI